jgi:hypothetical protein
MIHESAIIEFFTDEGQTTKPGQTPEISIQFNGLVRHESMREIIAFIRKIQARDFGEALHVFSSFQNIDD